jgi:hypothetical protein
MPLQSAVVTFALRTTPGVQSVTGVGFAGSVLLLWTTRQTAAGVTDATQLGIGLTDGVTQACRSIHHPDNETAPTSAQVQQTTARVIKLTNATTGATPTVEVEVAFTAFTADGFTLDVLTTDGAAILCHALVLGGAELEADALTTPPISAPTVTVTTGFRPTAFLTLGGTEGGDYVLGRPFGSMHGLGFSDGTTNLCTWALSRAPTGFGADTRRGQRTDVLYSIRLANLTGAAELASGWISAVSATGYTITRGTATVTAQPFILALKGVRVALGTLTQPAAPGVQTIPIPFAADAILLQTHGEVAGDNLLHYALMIGAWASNDGQAAAYGAGLHSADPTIHVRSFNASRALELYSPAAAGASSTLVAAATVSAVRADGFDLTWATTDGVARQVLYYALGTAAGGCSGGLVPTVADPEDGTTFTGLGPHADRVFLELALDTGLEQWALHDPMNDAADLAVHGGRKDGRLISVGAVTRRTTDRLGGWQTSGARFQADDHDRRIRGLIAAGAWYNREFRIYVAERLAVADARCLGRFITREYPPTVELTVDVDGVDIIGSEFSPFALDRDVLASCVFDRARVPTAPAALLESKRPIPVYMGRWSDEGSTTAAPTWFGAAWRGAVTEPPYWEMGFAEMPAGGPPPPTSVAAAAEPGGSILAGDVPSGVFFQVWAVTGGVEGDPAPFFGDAIPATAVPSDGSAVRVSWTWGGADPDAWRVGLATNYYRARWSQVLEVAGAAREALFTVHPGLTPGATASYTNRGEYRVLANMPDGRTPAALPFVIATTGPYRRPVHVSWIPVAGALSYEVYKAPVPSAYFGITERFTVPVQLDSDGLAYFDDTWVAGEATTTIPAPAGLLPVTDCGDVTLTTGDAALDGTWGLMCLSRWAWHAILGVYAGGTRLTTSDPDVLHADHAAWPFTTRTRPLGDCACMVLYVRGARLAAHRDRTAELRVNACTTEDVGNGLGSTITQAARGVQHLVTELVMNDARGGAPWAGIPTFDDGVPMIRSSSYAAAELTQIARVGGEGYEMRLALDASTTLRSLIQGFVQSFGLHHGINRHGQVVAGHYDDAVDPARVYPLVTDARAIVGDVTIQPRTHELETTIPYRAGYQPIDQKYAIDDVTVEDAGAVAANRGKPRVGPDRTLAYTVDPATIADVMARALQLGRSVRSWVEVPVGIDPGLAVDLFDVVRVRDEAGPIGPAGAEEASILVLEHEVRPPDLSSDRPLTVLLRGLDITALLDTAWAWGPDTITDWDSMTPDERGTWGAWAADDDTIPTDGARAREWR